MILYDFIFLSLAFGLPILISASVFLREPNGRPFLASYMLAVVGSSVMFVIFAFVLALMQIGGLGPFDGIFEVIVSVPIALIIGLIVRHKRRSSDL